MPPVSERFGGNSETGDSKDIQHRRSSEPHEHDVVAPARDTFGNRLRDLAITHRLIVKCPVRLDVNEARTAATRNLRKYANLFEHRSRNLVPWQFQLQPPEIRAIWIARVRPDRQLPAKRLLDCCLHGSFVARMPAARTMKTTIEQALRWK